MFWDELQERHPCAQMLWALFSNQLCGFRRPERTSGLSTLSTLFRKLKRLVVVSEMTCFKFWSWHKRLLLLKQMVGRKTPIGAGGPKTEAVVVSIDNSSLASLQLLHSPFMWAKKELYQTESLFSWNTGVRGEEVWPYIRAEFTTEKITFLLSSSLSQGQLSLDMSHMLVCWLMLRLQHEPHPLPHPRGKGRALWSQPDVLSHCVLDHLAWLGYLRREANGCKISKLKWALQTLWEKQS